MLIVEGNEIYSTENYSGAAEKYRAAAEVDPANGEAHSRLGTALRQLGLYKEALESSKRAVPLTPDGPERAIIFDNMGVCESNLGHPVTAVLYSGIALKFQPKNARIRVHRGISYEKAGQYDRAHTDALMALKFRPGYPPALRLKLRLELSGHVTPLG